MSSSNDRKHLASTLLGSAFLMATSAIGPGFITQTTIFTEKLLTSFGFVILCSIVLDIIVQLNIWRVVSASGMYAQDLSNKYLKGSGHALSLLIFVGGMAFNIGNIAGCALGLQVMFDLPLTTGVIISTGIAIFIFLYREAGKAVDVFSKVLGGVMILMTLIIVIKSDPPLLKTIHHSIAPEVIDTTAIIILVGGTVGGYISFAGVHRLIDSGIVGPANTKSVSQASIKGVVVASLMRILLFLAALGVISAGAKLDPGNPAASVFSSAAGNIGYKIFGLVLWCAAITSVVGSAYTSITFVKTIRAGWSRYERYMTAIFILFSGVVFLVVGRPVAILVIVGALNAFILPFAMAIILLVSRHRQFMGSYSHPRILEWLGWVVVIVLAFMSVKTALDLGELW